MTVKSKVRFDDSLRKRIEGKLCVYCGEIANCYDHFPPAVCTGHDLLLPSCNECNTLAGTEFSYDFSSRANQVTLKLRRKYVSFIDNPAWSQDELNELGYNLKIGTSEWQMIKSIALNRIAWNAMSYIASIDHNSYFAQFDARIRITTNSEKISCESIEQENKNNNYISRANSIVRKKNCAYCGVEFRVKSAKAAYCNKHRNVSSRKGSVS